MPQAILLKDVEGLGEAGAVVDVSPGYLRNYLGSAQARPGGDAGLGRGRPARARAGREAAREQEERAQETAALLSKTVLTIPHQAGEDGRLFGSVTAKEIVDAIKPGARPQASTGARCGWTQPIRELGTHMVEIEVAAGRHGIRQDHGRGAEVMTAPAPAGAGVWR